MLFSSLKFRHIFFTHIHREGNRVVHMFACKAEDLVPFGDVNLFDNQ